MTHSTSNPTTPQPMLVPPREAARLLAISERTLWSLTRSREIPHVRLRRCVRYDIEDLREWIATNKNGGGT